VTEDANIVLKNTDCMGDFGNTVSC